ncbi:receptor kinase 3 [Prunus dulcis]|uniref:Receptor kinase 3 n=1 Tax=Prunus dulcis TaxID=3755 RepID=A0A4Y1QYR1_PRUDU|nr:receptor kinase 3 [Prunus dulcis]
MASSIQSAASVSNLADRLRVRANEVQKLTTENSSLQRMLHESQQEVEKLKGENNSLLKLVSSYSVDTLRRLDMLQVSNKEFWETMRGSWLGLRGAVLFLQRLPEHNGLHLYCRIKDLQVRSLVYMYSTGETASSHINIIIKDLQVLMRGR